MANSASAGCPWTREATTELLVPWLVCCRVGQYHLKECGAECAEKLEDDCDQDYCAKRTWEDPRRATTDA